jgi:tetratricopeptide (TPR) repeat protein
MSQNVFLSAVSSECRSAREKVASDLRSRGLTVKEQGDFRQETQADTTLRKLHDYITNCWAVVCIVGQRSGGFPPTLAAEPFRHLLPPVLSRASYSQWELIFARYCKCRCSIYIATAAHAPDGSPGDDDDPELQEQFVAYLRNEGLDRDYFTTVDELRWKVLREDWPQLQRTKPNTLPYPPLGSLFKGRDGFLRTLRQSFLCTDRDERAKAITGRALHGLGGVGKTRLAVEYAWRYEQEYSALLFVSGDTPQTLGSNIAQLAGPLAIELPADVKQDAAMAAVLGWLERNQNWFLIIDNLDTPEAALAAQQMLARLKAGHVVLTRIGQWHPYVEPFELDVLPTADGKAFLLESTQGRRRRLPSDDADADALAEELGGLALALEQSAAYIRKRRISFSRYLGEWRSHKPEVQVWHDPLLMPYPKSVAVTWETTLLQLGAGEIALLRMLSFFAPDPIPMWLLEHERAPPLWQEAVTWVTDEFVAAAGHGTRGAGPVGDTMPPADQADAWRDALAQLADFSLARWNADAGTVTVHRVLQEIVRTRLLPGRKSVWLLGALRLLDAVAPDTPDDVRTWPRWNLLQPHVAHASAAGEAEGIALPTSGLMNGLAELLYAKALHAQAEPLMRRALAIDEASFGPEHPQVASDLSNLAQLLQATNRLTEAEPLMQRALKIDTAHFGPEHPKVAIRLNNLARLFHATNRLAEAEPLMRHALAIDESRFGPRHPKVAIRLNNLARLLQDTSRLAQAEPLMRRAIEIDEATMGPESPEVATDLINLARVLQASNRLTEAEPLIRRASAIDETCFGPHHPEVATDSMNLALLLQATHRAAEARPLMRRAVEILQHFRRTTGHDHPNFKMACAHYAALLDAVGCSELEVGAELARVSDGARAAQC